MALLVKGETDIAMSENFFGSEKTKQNVEVIYYECPSDRALRIESLCRIVARCHVLVFPSFAYVLINCLS